MEKRFFILDKFNTWHDWRCTLTAKEIQDAEPKTNYVNIDGASGSIDFSEALTGEPVYSDRVVTASFMCSEGTHAEREALLRSIRSALHGRKIQIIEPDDPAHYFLGRVKITAAKNYLAYAEFTVEATCEPWRYALEETTREVAVTSAGVGMVVNNHGDRTVCPVLKVTGSARITANAKTLALTTGTYKVSDFRLPRGVNVVNVAGVGSLSLTYREAVL